MNDSSICSGCGFFIECCECFLSSSTAEEITVGAAMAGMEGKPYNGKMELYAAKRIVLEINLETGEWSSPMCGRSGVVDSVAEALVVAREIKGEFVDVKDDPKSKKLPRRKCPQCRKSRAVCHYKTSTGACKMCLKRDHVFAHWEFIIERQGKSWFDSNREQ